MIGKIEAYYDAKTGGFHLDDADGRVKISGKRHKQLLDGQAKGKEIFTGPDGQPKLKTRTVPLATIRDAKLANLDRKYQKAVAGLTDAELSKSGVLAAMAMECSIWIVSNDPGDCPMLSAYAKQAGRTMDGSFVQEVMERYHNFASNAGRLAAKYDQMVKEVRSANSKTAIQSVSW